MSLIREIVSQALKIRDANKIPVRQPLASVTIYNSLDEEFEKIIAEEVNVKKVIFDKKAKEVSLDISITPELEAEGYSREIARKIQSERKNRNMKKEERITLELYVTTRVRNFLHPYLDFISKRVGAVKVIFDDDKHKKMVFFDVKNEKIGFNF